MKCLFLGGLYINPSDAFKFLSNQLSWIGIGVSAVNGLEDNITTRKPSNNAATDDHAIEPGEEPSTEHDPEEDKLHLGELSSTGMSRATSFVSDGMKAVGETVSRYFSFDYR
jgi:hypothetical protein